MRNGSPPGLRSKYGLLMPGPAPRWPSRGLLLAAVAAGFLLGLLLGRDHISHRAALLGEQATAAASGGPARVALPDAAAAAAAAAQQLGSRAAAAGAAGAARAKTIAAAAAAQTTAAAVSQAVSAGKAIGEATGTRTSSGSGSTAASLPPPPPRPPPSPESPQRFVRGTGARSSFMHSTSNITGLTPADSRRLSAALQARAAQLPGDSVHALMTSDGCAYQNMQARIMYGTMKLVQAMPGGATIRAFTRIMHRTRDDEMVGELPTFRAYPLQPACDVWCAFPVSDRANAIVQWLLAAAEHPELIQGAWLLLLESDYAWMKPLPLPGSAHDLAVAGYGYTYGYMAPQDEDLAEVLQALCPSCDLAKVPSSGPAPVLLRPAELALIAPEWERLTAAIEANATATEKLGWVRDMYSWDLAVALAGVQLTHEEAPASPLMAQPPQDFTMGNASFAHYTWGPQYFDANGTEVWKFEKRDFTEPQQARKVALFPMPPQPWRPGRWHLQEFFRNETVTLELHATLTAMLQQINKAVALLPVIEPVVAEA